MTRAAATRTLRGVCISLAVGAGATQAEGCVDPDICWECTSLEEGGVTQAHQARIDNFFVATDRLTRTFDTIRADFDADVLALAWTYGVLEPGERAVVHVDFVRELTQVIDADVADHVEGGLAVLYTPPRCQADIPAALAAQRGCEASSECEVETPQLSAPVACLGICDGVCDGVCSGEHACALASAGACDGLCEGSCALAGPAECSGTCRGACSGSCTRLDPDGACAGACAGMCAGVCELSTPAACSGSCYGTCLVDASAPSCAGETRCRGGCDGVCVGACRGPLRTVSSEDHRCEATEECRGSSSSFAAVGLRCSPPALDLQYVFKDSIDESARAAFAVRLGELERRGAAVLQASARLRALVNGVLEGAPVYERSPYAALRDKIDHLASSSLAELGEIPKVHERCLHPGLAEASAVLLGYAPEVAVLRASQDEFASIFGVE